AVKTSFGPRIAERLALPTAAADDADDAEGADTNGEDASNAAKAAADQQDGAAEGDARADHAGESNAAEEAAKAHERLAGWVFQIPSNKYDQIFKPLEELIESDRHLLSTLLALRAGRELAGHFLLRSSITRVPLQRSCQARRAGSIQIHAYAAHSGRNAATTAALRAGSGQSFQMSGSPTIKGEHSSATHI